jgi:DNA-binding Lrp family transcriptional regulator
MKEVELRLVSELLKKSRRSDSELAKAIGVSQPTVTRTRVNLEKQGYVVEYTMIPNFLKLGFHIAAFGFVKLREPVDPEKIVEFRKKFMTICKKGIPEVLVADIGKGMGYSGVFFSFHENYSSYVEFIDNLKQISLWDTTEFESFLVDLDAKIHYRQLTFSTLANYILTHEKMKE